MALPDLIEIVSLSKRVSAEITVPGSKSITNRALILAALGRGESTLEGALWSEDTQVMIEALRVLGFEVHVEEDSREPCNRLIRVNGQGGTVPRSGTQAQPLPILVGNAGTAARFLAALVCLGRGFYRLTGTSRMHERPQAALFSALRSLGYEVDSENDRLPATIRGSGPRSGRCRVSIEESSQFASGLLLCAPAGSWQVEVVGENAEESFYVSMTSRLVQQLWPTNRRFGIEPDASSGSYFLAADRIMPPPASGEGGVRVSGWPSSGLQIDEHFPEVLRSLMALEPGVERQRAFQPGIATKVEARQRAGDWAISRTQDLGDSIMTAVVLAPFACEPIRFTDLGRLRVQECERVRALRTELTRCGAKVIERGDTLEVFPSQPHGAVIETYDDHRMAMCFAILGLKVPGIRIKNPACVKKTFPNFFQKLAAPPPTGLGVVIRNGHTLEALPMEDLFAT